MASAVRISASLWSVDPANIDPAVDRLVDAGLRSWHWDASDGTVGPEGGFTAAAARGIAERTGLASDAHLMMLDPRPAVAEWAAFCEMVAVHFESPHWQEAVRLIAHAGSTPAVAVSPGSLPDPRELDGLGVLVMSVRPGHAGEAFDAGCFERIAAYTGRSPLGVDGSMTPERAAMATLLGADWIVSGTSLIADPEAWLG